MNIKLFIVILSIPFLSAAQNSLSFDQASIVDIPIGGTVTVPSGKVWKVENVGMNQNKSTYSPSITIDGELFNTSQNFNGPIWINENSVIERGTESGQSSPAIKLSILEFTVTNGSSGGSGGIGSGGIGSEGMTFQGVLFEQFGPFNPNTYQILGSMTIPPSTVYKITSISISGSGGATPVGTVFFNDHAIKTTDIGAIQYLGPGTYEVALRESNDANYCTITGLIYSY